MTDTKVIFTTTLADNTTVKDTINDVKSDVADNAINAVGDVIKDFRAGADISAIKRQIIDTSVDPEA